MSGRHRSPARQGTPQRRIPWLPVGIAAAVVAAAGITFAVIASGDNGAPPGCDDEGVPLPVAAAPSIAAVVEEVAEAEREAGRLDACVEVTVTAEESPAVAEADVTADSPALWIADASLWGEALAERTGDGVVENLGSMASSPLVIAASTPVAESLAGTTGDEVAEVPWDRLLAGTVPVGVVDPETTTEGRATLATLEAVLGGQPGEPPPANLVRSFVGLSRGVLPSADGALEVLSGGEGAPVVLLPEQSVLNHGEGESAIRPVYPSQGTSFLDYPVLRLNRPGEPAGVDAAAQALAEALQSDRAATALREAGFRTADGGLGDARQAGVRAEPPPNLSPLSLALTQDALRTWSAVTLEARMLAVIDVSGSMDEDAGRGRTRVELARDAAVAALRLYPESAQIGLWDFSVQRNPPADWESLVDIGPLGDDMNGSTRREVLIENVGTLPAKVGGGTGLYDTALAAFRTVRAGYVPARVNSVVLLTDGRNEDTDGIDLPTLLRTLRAEFDPAQPVPIITIGMGPEADVETLRQISETTGGKAYVAVDPNEIEGVFLDAMIERRCRPSC